MQLKLHSQYLTIAPNSSKRVDLSDTGSKIRFLQASNFGAAPVKLSLDGAIITVPGQSTQCIPTTDGFEFTTVEVGNPGVITVEVEIVAGLTNSDTPTN